MGNTVPSRTKVFISYSHKDAAALERLQVHLKPHTRAGILDFWADTRIRPGQEFDREIREALAAARIAVLLISADFYASDYIMGVEVPAILEAAATGGLIVLCVILSPSSFLSDRRLSRVQAVNDPMTPVLSMSRIDQEALWVRLANEVVRNLTPEAPEISPVPPSVALPVPPPSLSPETAVRPPPAPRKGVFGLPFARNTVFTGRADVLEQIEAWLWNAPGNRWPRIMALSGLGGIGKTQTALEYACRNRDRYRQVFWVLADTETSLREGFSEAGRLLDLPEKEAPEQERTVQAVKRWLEENDGWLLILDNVDEVETARRYFPVDGRGHMLLTTRAGVIGPGMKVTRLKGMGLHEGATLLLRRAGRVEMDGSLEDASEADREAALALSDMVGGLPLALDQAGAYILNRQRTPADYLERYTRERAQLLAKPGGHGTGAHDPVTITFSLAFGRLKSGGAGSDLVRACAFLAPDAIPDELFRKGASALGANLCAAGEDEDAWDDAVAEATKYSLLHRDPDAHTLSLHRLVQSVLQDSMHAPERWVWKERCVRALARVFPDPEYPVWGLCERLLPHTMVAARWVAEEGLEDPESANLLLYAGTFLDYRARYAEAEPFLERALAMLEKSLGPRDLRTADCLSELAVNCYQKGDQERAKALSVRVLHIREEVLGPEHPKVAESLSNLASVNRRMGLYEEVEPLHLRAIQIQEATLGPDHSDTAATLNNLAVFYFVQKLPEKAEPVFRRVLGILDRTLGSQHPYTMTAVNNLGILCFEGGRYGEAREFFERALSAREQVLGPRHPDTLGTVGRLRKLYRLQGHEVEAEELETRFPESREADVENG